MFELREQSKAPTKSQAPVQKRLWNTPSSLHLGNHNLFICQEKETMQISQHKYIHPSFFLHYPNLKWKLVIKPQAGWCICCTAPEPVPFCFVKACISKAWGLPRALPAFSLKHPHPAVFPAQNLLQRKAIRDAYTNTEVKTWKPGHILALCRYKRPSTH